MRLAGIGFGTLVVAAAFAMPADARAQALCLADMGTPVDGTCLPAPSDDYGVDGIVDGALRLIHDTLPDCTPSVLGRPPLCLA